MKPVLNFISSSFLLISVYLFILYLLPGQSLAQEKLTLNKAWAIAFENNYSIDQQEKVIERAREEISIQQTEYYPSLATSGLFARANFDKFPINLPNASGDVGLDLLSLSVTQPIFTGFRTKNLVATAKEQLIAQETQKKLINNTVLYEVGNLFYDIQSNLFLQDVLKSSINRLSIQLDRVKNLYLSEQATPFDTLEIANRKLQTVNQFSVLEDRYLILVSRLKYLLNDQNIPEVQKLSPASLDLNLKTINDYANSAFHHRPELRQVNTKKKIMDFSSEIIESRYYPQLSAALGYNFMKIKGNISSGEWTNFYSIQLNLQWELWNWQRDSKKIQQISLDLENLQIQEKQIIEDIKYQITVAYQNLLSSLKKIDLQKRLVDQEKERYQIMENRYHQGLATFLDLSAAELDLTKAHAELQNHYISWYKNKLQLDYATGEINQNYMEDHND